VDVEKNLDTFYVLRKVKGRVGLEKITVKNVVAMKSVRRSW
jgi:hypothetical protein